jgi:hypothetical protein
MISIRVVEGSATAWNGRDAQGRLVHNVNPLTKSVSGRAFGLDETSTILTQEQSIDRAHPILTQAQWIDETRTVLT